jgi:acetyl esterase
MVKAYKGYEDHLASNLCEKNEDEKEAAARQAKVLISYNLPEGMSMEDIEIDGPDDGQKLTLRIYRPKNLSENAPVVLDIHGGGWVGGNLDIDNYRCIEIAQRTPCLVVSVAYRLTTKEVCYPKPLMDCLSALQYIYDHALELGVDKNKIALHGTSAGANIAAGLALYVRDHCDFELKFTILNCPVLTLDYVRDPSFRDLKEYRMRSKKPDENVDYLYLGGYTEDIPPIYAFAGYCKDLKGLCPHMIIVGEYDTLRDDGMRYANHLLEQQVPCELILAPRVGHGFCTVPEKLTQWVHEGVALSLRREFEMI